jgi:hypothetical protein
MTEKPDYKCEIVIEPYGISHKTGSLEECFVFIAENKKVVSRATIDKIRHPKKAGAP